MAIKKLHSMGLRSEHAYTAAIVSIGLSIASWVGSLKLEPGQDLARADRWGIFVGHWAPTLFGLGLALSQYEQSDETAAEVKALEEAFARSAY